VLEIAIHVGAVLEDRPDPSRPRPKLAPTVPFLSQPEVGERGGIDPLRGERLLVGLSRAPGDALGGEQLFRFDP